MPAALWWTLVVGALVNLALIALPAGQELSAHLVFTGVFALLIDVVIFLIATMDNSFRGEFSIDPSAYEIIRERLMDRF